MAVEFECVVDAAYPKAAELVPLAVDKYPTAVAPVPESAVFPIAILLDPDDLE